jgi:5'-methylthioadenosine phosphorylase
MSKRRLGLILGTGYGAALRGLSSRSIEVKTDWGAHSPGLFALGTEADAPVMLLRHGDGHVLPPHRINHRANFQALAQLDVTHIVSMTSAGSLHRAVRMKTFVMPDDFIDCSGSVTTVFDTQVKHTSMHQPFDGELLRFVYGIVAGAFECVHGGTYVSIAGPRFPTRAEVRLYRQLGSLIGMTLAPETILANELGIPYVNCSWITDNTTAASHDANVSRAPDASKLRTTLLRLVEAFQHYPEAARAPNPIWKRLLR